MNNKHVLGRALACMAGSLVVGSAGATSVAVSAPAAPVVAQAVVLPAPVLAATPVAAPVAPNVVQLVSIAAPESAPVPVTAAAPVVLLAFTLPAPGAEQGRVRAAPVGWSDGEIGAARVRNLQTMMMVGSLRCRSIGIDVLTDYNGFVTSARDTLVAVNDAIKARLIATFGKATGEERYDKFTTSLANAFGADATSAETCDALRGIVHRASEGAASRATLLQIADSAHLDSGLPALVRTSVEMAAR